MGKLLTIDEAAAVMRVTVGTLRNWRTLGTGPVSGKLGKRVFYREADVLAWVEAQFTDAAAG